MSLFSRILRILIVLALLPSFALADIPQELQTVILEGNLYGHSSVDFRKNAKNITSLIPEGTEGTVLETRKLSRTGSYGVRIRINNVSKNLGKTTAKKDDEVWVYYSQKDPWLSFQDKAGEDIQDPEEALTSRAKRDGVALSTEGIVQNPKLPTKKEVQARTQQIEKEVDARAAEKKIDPNLFMTTDKTFTEGGFLEVCKTCSKNGEVIDKNLSDIKDVATVTSGREPARDPGNLWADDPYISAYSNSQNVADMIKAAKKSKSAKSRKLCYRYVKNAMLAGSIIDKYPPGGRAKDAVADLKAQGMTNLLDNPKYKDLIKTPADVPKGAIIVYSTGESKEAGHIEIKTDNGDKGTYISDYESKNSVQQSVKGLYKQKIGKPYKIIGVMITPPEDL